MDTDNTPQEDLSLVQNSDEIEDQQPEPAATPNPISLTQELDVLGAEQERVSSDVLARQTGSNSIVKKFIENKTKFSIFHSMEDAEILSITRNIKFKKYRAGEIIIQEGREGGEVYYLLAGKCNVIANRSVVGIFSIGSVFGEIAAFKRTARTASVRALENSALFIFEINYAVEDKFPIAFKKYYKNLVTDLISKLDRANHKKH